MMSMNDGGMTVQLPLNIQLRDDATLDSFYPGDNLEVLNSVSQMAMGEGEQFLYLFGKIGVGRSHLLQAACHHAVSINLSAMYIPLSDLSTLSPLMLQGLEKRALLCMDDIDLIAGNELWEEGLFHLFNRMHSVGTRFMVSASMAPAHIPIVLPDLKSRLAWGLSAQLHPLNDEQKLEALQLRAKCRGLTLHASVGQFLLSRCSRNMTELFASLAQLDRASLAEQRRLTIPFVKHVLGL